MTTQETSCSSQPTGQNIQPRKPCANPQHCVTPNSPFVTAQHQYIGGVIVPTPVVAQKFPIADTGRTPNTQKVSQSIPTSNTAVVVQRAQLPQVILTNEPTLNTGGIGIMSETAANKADGGSTQKIRISQSGILYTLNMIREPVVEYQETRGIPRNEEITFVTLVTSLCTQAYTAAITILVMLWNLMPLVDGLVYFVRFFLDKLIDIVQTPDNKDKAIKGAIFFGELTVVTFIIFLIVGLIFMPVYVLMARLFSKVFSMIAW